jgi:hypothetical protein
LQTGLQLFYEFFLLGPVYQVLAGLEHGGQLVVRADLEQVGQRRALGIDPGMVRLVIVIAASLATAAAVAVSGLIAFVGIIVPHLVRLLAGSSYRVVLPLSILFGAAFLVLEEERAARARGARIYARIRGAATTAGDVADDADYRRVHPLSRLSDTWYAGSAVQLDSGTTYSLKMVSSAFATSQYATVSTRSNTFQKATGVTYHVNPVTGQDTNSGLASNLAFRTLGRALTEADAGVTILLYSGRYYEGDLTVPHSGTATQPFAIENAPGATPVLDGTDTNFLPTWVLHDTANSVYRTATVRAPENAYLDGVHLYRYLNLSDLATNRWTQPGGYYADGSHLYVRFPGGAPPAGHLLTIPASTSPRAT